MGLIVGYCEVVEPTYFYGPNPSPKSISGLQ